MRINISKSRTGIPCLWECGGGYTNTGSATIITDKNGYPKRAIYVRTHGDRCNGDHALIPVSVGDKVVVAKTHRDETSVTVFVISAIYDDGAELEPCATPIAEDAIMAAITKAHQYHCRRPFYIKERQRQWYQQISGDGRETALVTVDESVYRLGYRDQQLEHMVFDTCHNLVFVLPTPQHVDFEAHFFINVDGDLEKAVREN